jgi:NAD(P)H-dependent FMN reductase
MTRKVVAIVGSYRRGGMVDQAVAEVLRGAEASGARTNTVYLIDRHIEFCRNCRACTQTPGPVRGRCVQEDDFEGLLAEIDAADALVVGAPVNFYNVTAVTRRFLERLIGGAYWPWGRPGPKLRVRRPAKPAVVVTSSAMPAAMGRIFTGAVRALKLLCRSVGAKPIGTLFVGMAAADRTPRLPVTHRTRARRLGARLAN